MGADFACLLWTIVQATSLGSGGHAPLFPASRCQTLRSAASLGRTFRRTPGQKTRTAFATSGFLVDLSLLGACQAGELGIFVIKMKVPCRHAAAAVYCVLCNM